MSNPPVLWDIESDPALAGTKMIQKRGEQPGYIKAQELATCIWENSVACATQGVIRQTRVGGMLHFADMPTTCRLRDLTRDFIG
jgi:hypothetical protein